jgi:Na+-driven multidrug efflux pump
MNLAVSTIIGHVAVKTDKKNVEKLIWLMMLFCSTLYIILGFGLFLIRKQVIALYTHDPDMQNTVELLLITVVLAIPFLWTPSFQNAYSLRAAGDVKFTLVVATCCAWGLRVFLSWFFVKVMGFEILFIWIAQYIEWTTRGVIYCIRLASGKWVLKTLPVKD